MGPFRKHTSLMPRSKKTRSSGLPLQPLLSCLLLLAPALAAAASAPATGDFSAQAREIETLAERVVQQSRIPGMAMAIVQDGKVVSLRGYGVVDSPPMTIGQAPITKAARKRPTPNPVHRCERMLRTPPTTTASVGTAR